MAQHAEWKQFVVRCHQNDWNFVVWFAGKQHLIRSREEADRRFPNKNTRGLCRWVAQQKGLWQHGNVPKSVANVISSYSRGMFFTPERCTLILRKLLNGFLGETKGVLITTGDGYWEYKKPRGFKVLKIRLQNTSGDRMSAEYGRIFLLTSDATALTLKSHAEEGDGALNNGLARFCGSRLKSIEVVLSVPNPPDRGNRIFDSIQIQFKHIPQFSGTYPFKSAWPAGYARTFSWADLTS